jgi:hypothetical protein
MMVAPLNALLNWLLGIAHWPFVFSPHLHFSVFGPEPIRLGYIGAPIATAGMNGSTSLPQFHSKDAKYCSVLQHGILTVRWLRYRVSTGMEPVCICTKASFIFSMYVIMMILRASFERLNRKSAWHPVCWRSFQNLGILFHLGMAGVGSSLSLPCARGL